MNHLNTPRRASFRRISSVGLAGLFIFLLASPTLAHEEREVAGYTWEVGLIGEPVFVDEESGLEFFVNKGDTPIEGLETTLKAEVIMGQAKRDLPIRVQFGEKGAYKSVFLPTAAGKYTFHIFGTVEGIAVDESFTSKEGGFAEVQEATSGQFPVTLATSAELSAEAKKGADAAGQLPIALALGGAGLVVGLVALGVALAGRRRPVA
ncbi:MAG: hypothetical protein M3P84_08100 [Chloroflexota bacterium]|nr:hypothetical protein [Chloroflexota bacterium]